VKTSVRWRHNGLELRLPWRSTRVTDPAFFAGRSAGALPTARSCRARQGAGPDGGRDGLPEEHRDGVRSACTVPHTVPAQHPPAPHLRCVAGAGVRSGQVCPIGRHTWAGVRRRCPGPERGLSQRRRLLLGP